MIEIDDMKKFNLSYDFIDKPILPLIKEINRIGIRTLFSCCGTHLEKRKTDMGEAYITYRAPNSKEEKKFYKDFEMIAGKCGWRVDSYTYGIRAPVAPDYIYKEEEIKNLVKNFNIKLNRILIKNLTAAIEKLPTVNSSVNIVNTFEIPNWTLLVKNKC